MIRKLFLVLGFLTISSTLFAQNRLKLEDSEVRFFSEAPLEDIEAVNKAAVGVIDMENGSFLFRVPIKEFRFDKKLMEEHFNENYLESAKYPRASFKGKFTRFPDLRSGSKQELMAEGELEIHGIARKRSIRVVITPEQQGWSLKSAFSVLLEDHDIEIPTVVFNKIAEEVEVTVKGTLLPLK